MIFKQGFNIIHSMRVIFQILRPNLFPSLTPYDTTPHHTTPLHYTTPSHCTQHRYIFANYARDSVNASPPQGLIKLDVDAGTETTWMGGPDQFLSEPVFAKKKDAGNFFYCADIMSSSALHRNILFHV